MVIALSRAANRAKTKWNAKNYSQVKVSVDPEIAAAFKTACGIAGHSMASVLSQFMAHYSATMKKSNSTTEDDVSTRGKRRKLVQAYTQRLERVRAAEENYMSNIPVNLQGSIRYEAAEQSVSVMDEVIERLGEIY